MDRAIMFEIDEYYELRKYCFFKKALQLISDIWLTQNAPRVLVQYYVKIIY